MRNAWAIKILAAVFAVLTLMSAINARAADNNVSHARVVIQVSDDDAKKWNLALNNAKNVQQEFGAANVDIELVAFGPGINMLKFDSVVGERIDEAVKVGVQVVACENSMRAYKLLKSDMMANVVYVPSGVAEIIRKQQQGYAYLRP